MKSLRSQSKSSTHRSGAAIAELAVCLPVLLMLFLASIECCNMIFLKQTLSVSCYEGARRAISFDGTNDETLARCSEMLGIRNVANAAINISENDVSTAPKGTPITVTVSATCAENSTLPLRLFGNQTLTSSITMAKE